MSCVHLGHSAPSKASTILATQLVQSSSLQKQPRLKGLLSSVNRLRHSEHVDRVVPASVGLNLISDISIKSNYLGKCCLNKTSGEQFLNGSICYGYFYK